MAEVNLGDLTAHLKVDLTDFQRGMQQAQQQLGAMQQRLQGQHSAQQQAQQSSQQLATAYRALTQAATQQTQALSQTQQQLRQIQQTMQQTAQTAQQAGSAWQQAFAVAGGIGLATSLGALVSQMRDFAVSTVQVGARMEQLRASFSALAGSTSAGQQQFEQLFQTAQRLGVPFESLARGWRTLTAASTQAGLPLSDQRRLLEAVAREGQRVGATNEELTRAFSALGQMAGKGTVSMEELRQQLGEAIPTALAAMARGMGRTTDELIKLVEAGGVRFPTAARALTRGLEEIQSTGLSTATTLQASFNRFTNEVIRAKDELLRMGGPLKAATDAATNFLKVLSDSAQAQRQLAEARAQEGRIGTGLREGDIRQLSTEQQRRLTQLNRLLGEQTLQLTDPNAVPMFQPTREEYIAQLKAERDAIYASAQAIKDKTTEQKAATAAINKARSDEERQRDALADLTKQMDAITKAAADFRRQAGLSPAVYGREGGTPEEQQQFLKERETRLRPMLEKLTEAVATVPQGITIPPEMLERLRQFNIEYEKIRATMKSINDQQAQGRKDATQAEREALAADRERRQQAEATGKAYLQALDQEIRLQEQALHTLQQLASGYTQTKEARDIDTASALKAQFATNEAIQQQADLVIALSTTRQAYQEELDAAKASFAVIKERTDLLVKAEDAQAAFSQRIESAITQAQGTRAERPELRLRAEAEQAGLTLTPEQEARLQVLTRTREEQERLQYTLRLFEQTAQSVGSAWVSALESIANGTKTVSEAFRAMGQAILQTMTQIAAQEATRAFIQLGFRLLTGALTTSVSGSITPNATQYSSPIGPTESGGFLGVGTGTGGGGLGGVLAYQHGGMITRPTLALMGERGTEYVLNQRQMTNLMSSQLRTGASASAGGEVHVHNHPSRESAERAAAQDRSQGHRAVVNEVLTDLARGESSQINRMMRTLSR